MSSKLHSNTLATWCKELTPWKRPWCWERWKAGGEGDERGWDGWMASLTQWTWVWVNSGSWWWTGRPGMLQSLESQRVGHDQATKLKWTELKLLSQFIPPSPSHTVSTCLFSMCLHCCPANRFIGTIFLDSIHMCWYIISVFIFLTYFTLYNRL